MSSDVALFDEMELYLLQPIKKNIMTNSSCIIYLYYYDGLDTSFHITGNSLLKAEAEKQWILF